jgi:tetratricopeptide (TPR) repeat protein
MAPSIGTESAGHESAKRPLLLRSSVVVFGAAGVLAAWLAAHREGPTRLSFSAPSALTPDRAGYVGDGACRSCHADIAATFSQHPMGRSLAPIEKAAAPPGGFDAAQLEFEAGGLVYAVEHRGSGVVHREMRRDRSGRVIAEFEADVRYAVGSARQGISYLIERDGFLLESPITWYAKERRWGLSPGYERRTSRFDRPVLPECLFCHANRVEQVSSAINRYQTPIFQGYAIGCERCHGPGDRHVRVASGSDTTIVNPANLEPSLRDAVCEQCHLIGRRVARLGARGTDYRPGTPFYQYWSAFVPASAGDENKFASQPEQMRVSRCYRASEGRLGCISCHDPHVLPRPEDKTAYYRGRCLTCHREQGCQLPAQTRIAQRGSDDCVGCHMPRSESSNNPHVATTNHRIPRAGSEARNAPLHDAEAAAATVLVNFHRDLMSPEERASAERERGIALCRLGGATAAMQALPLLEAALAAHPDDLPALEAKAEALGRLGRPADGLAACRLALAKDPSRQTALENAANLAGLAGRYPEAIAYWKKAIAVNPWRCDYRAELALAEAATRDWKATADACRDALKLNPFVLQVRRRLLQSYLHLGDRDAAAAELGIILGFDPPDRDELSRMLTAPAGR